VQIFQAFFFGISGCFLMFKTIYHGLWDFVAYNPYCQHIPGVVQFGLPGALFMVLVSNNRRLIDRVLGNCDFPAWTLKIPWINATVVSWYGKERLKQLVEGYNNAGNILIEGGSPQSAFYSFKTTVGPNNCFYSQLLKTLITAEKIFAGSAPDQLIITLKQPITDAVKVFYLDRNFDIQDYTIFRLLIEDLSGDNFETDWRT
jgi:hypothetical protein